MERGIQRRTELLLGNENLSRIQNTKVLIFGLGGVGSWCAEALVRSGIRHITIVDSDRVCVTNCNRQLMATTKTIGQVKVEALRTRLLEINPDAEINALQMIYDYTTADSFHLETYDFIIDAIDSLTEKAHLILHATSLPKHITFFSSMGAALRIDPFKVRATEFWKIKGDALARALRNKYKKLKIFPGRKFLCVYSEETPMTNKIQTEKPTNLEFPDGSIDWNARKAQINGSLSHVTGIFGMSLAGLVIQSISSKG